MEFFGNLKILISGCAKTRTTLLQRLMSSFYDVEIIKLENSIDYFLKNIKNNILIKRESNTLFSNKLSQKEIDRQLKIIEDEDIKILVTKRNKEDVLKSTNHYVSEKRYDAVENQILKYGGVINYICDTDRLLIKPDVVQEEIAEKLNLKIKHKFSEYPNFVPKYLDNLKDNQYKLRKLGENY